MTRFAFIGAGNMARAMVEGLINKDVCPPDEIACLSGSGRTAAALGEQFGVQVRSRLADLVSGAEIVVLACKPQQLAQLDPSLASLTTGKLVLSILAGKRLETLERTFPKTRNLVRVMPNTPARIGAGVSGYCSRHPLSTDDQENIDALLGAMGHAVKVDETEMDALTAVSGSGPAYVFEFVAALREAGIAAGLKAETASLLAVETVAGAARLVSQTGEDPEELRNQVTSPNGTTFAALSALENGDFRKLIANAVQAAKSRSIELSQDD